MKYVEMSRQVLDLIGGVSNIKFVEHCATRLRIHYNVKSKVDVEAIKKVEYVVGVVNKSGVIQVIIGPNVHEAYTDFMEVSGFDVDGNNNEAVVEEEAEEKNLMYYVAQFGNFAAGIFMPIVPALITGGLILAIENILVNYAGVDTSSGTAQVLHAIFNAGFSMLPVWIGWTMAQKLRMQPIMGGFLGAVLVNSAINGVEGLDFFGISIPTTTYEFSVMPVILGVILLYWVDKGLGKIIPEAARAFLKPLLSMVIVVPITLIFLGPIGTVLSSTIGKVVVFLMERFSVITLPVLSILGPYMVMLGLDKALMPIMFQSISELGYDPFYLVMLLIYAVSIGASTLAIATSIKDKEQRGMITSFSITAFCGITEPSFYGALMTHPKCLLGVAIGSGTGGLIAGIFGFKNYVAGSCPGLLTPLYFMNPDGSMWNLILYFIICAATIIVSFIVTKIILKRDMGINKVK